MSDPIVLCDANVLYSILMTDLILSLGEAELFRPRWTNEIHEEWIRNVLEDQPERTREDLERRRAFDSQKLFGRVAIRRQLLGRVQTMWHASIVGERRNSSSQSFRKHYNGCSQDQEVFLQSWVRTVQMGIYEERERLRSVRMNAPLPDAVPHQDIQ